MKTKLLNFSLIVGAVFTMAFSCDNKNGASKSTTGLNEGESVGRLVNKNNLFSLRMFSDLNQQYKGDNNLVVSPFGINSALAMAYLGADGATKSQIQKVMNYGDESDANLEAFYKKMFNELPKIDPKTKFILANSIWHKKDVNISDSYLAKNRDFFDAKISGLDFSKSSAKDEINNWVSEKTNKLFPEIIKVVPPQASLYLINAIYFNGTWANKFNPNYTTERVFHKADGSEVKANFMSIKKQFRNYEDKEFMAVDLPYSEDKFSMTLVSSRNGNQSGSALVEKLAKSKSALMAIQGEMKPAMVNVSVPKFKFSYDFQNLKNYLIKSGMVDAFGSSANFKSISKEAPIFINDIKHKGVIDMNEQGTESAAVTTVEMMTLSALKEDISNFDFDKPFVFLIKENSTGLILFMGTINDPTLTEK